MTLMELQEVLGIQVERVQQSWMSAENRKEAFEQADMVARLAKQMINNADVILRADKLSNTSSHISSVVGDADGQAVS